MVTDTTPAPTAHSLAASWFEKTLRTSCDDQPNRWAFEIMWNPQHWQNLKPQLEELDFKNDEAVDALIRKYACANGLLKPAALDP